MVEQWLSADNTAARLGAAKDTVYTWTAEKGMLAHKVGRLWKIQGSGVDEWCAEAARQEKALREDSSVGCSW